MIYHQKLKTDFGTIFAYANDNELLGVYFRPMKMLAQTVTAENSVIYELRKQIEEYIRGKRKEFNLPLYLQGTEFQKRVWKTLQKIPFGETWSYAKQAASLGKKSAVRAVANANGKNPFSLVIPCHRVIRTDGSLGGYSGGISVKKKLLEFELKRRQLR